MGIHKPDISSGKFSPKITRTTLLRTSGFHENACQWSRFFHFCLSFVLHIYKNFLITNHLKFHFHLQGRVLIHGQVNTLCLLKIR